MIPLGLSANALSRDIDVPPNRITSIIASERAVNAGHSNPAGAPFDTTLLFWLNLQTAHDLSVTLAKHGTEINGPACIDMSPVFIKRVTENLPNAAITFDKIQCGQDRQRCRRPGTPGRTETAKPAARHLPDLAAQPGQSVGPPTGGARKPPDASSQDRAAPPDPAGVPGTP